MNSLFDCFIIVGLSTAVSLGGMLLVRRKISREALESCHEVGGVMLAVIGTLYAIVVGLIVVNSQGKVDQASQMAITEANMLSNIFHLSASFKEPARQSIRNHIHDYAVVVVGQDWSRVEQGLETEATIPPYKALWTEINAYVPELTNQQQAYALMLANMEDLSTARRYRMVASKCSLSSVLWTVLIGGGVMVVLFTYFFFVNSLRAQTIMTAFVAIALSTNVCLIYVCQNPYRPEFGAKQAGFGHSFTPDWFKEPPAPALEHKK